MVGQSNQEQKIVSPSHSEIDDLLAKKICKDLDIPKPTKT
jgi:hypothetical protein